MTPRLTYQDANKDLLAGLLKSEFYIKKSGLDAKLLELMKYRVSQINCCGFCIDMHHKEAVQMGETEQRLYSLAAWRECPYYSEKEIAVLTYAEALTLVDKEISMDALFHELNKFFSKSEIADLTLAITQINTWNRINRAFGKIPGNYKVAEQKITATP